MPKGVDRAAVAAAAWIDLTLDQLRSAHVTRAVHDAAQVATSLSCEFTVADFLKALLGASQDTPDLVDDITDERSFNFTHLSRLETSPDRSILLAKCWKRHAALYMMQVWIFCW